MIIKSVIVENFQSYYGIKEFKFKKGLNVILGANGHGKSKLFDAIQWLLNGEVEEDGVVFVKENLISKKALSEISIGDKVKVTVSMEMERGTINYLLNREYTVRKVTDDEVSINEQFIGHQLLDNGERQLRSGEDVLESVFPSALRRYSLFKGERSLNIFDPRKNQGALKKLVDSLSHFKSFDRYIEITDELYLASKNSIERLQRSNKKDKRAFDILINSRNIQNKRLIDKKEEIGNLEKELEYVVDKVDNSIGVLEKGESIKAVNNAISSKQTEITTLSLTIDKATDYPKLIFDDYWILNQFEGFQKKYDEKIKSFSRDKRRIGNEFLIELGAKKKEKEIIAKIANTPTPLPIHTPSQEHMEEMIDEEVCKVCNRPAEKGSDAHNFMTLKLREFVESLIPNKDNKEEEESEVAFCNDFVEEFIDLGKTLERNSKKVNGIINDISDSIEFSDKKKEELEKLKNRLDKLEEEKSKLLGKYSSGEGDLLQLATEIRKFSHDRTTYENRLTKCNFEKEELVKGLDKVEREIEKTSVDDVPSIYHEKKEILYDLSVVAKDIKNKKYNEFLNNLEEKANHYYSRLGKASQGYTGVVKIERSANDDVIVGAINEKTGEDVSSSLNSSTKTSLHLSILMAISDISSKKYSNSLPIILDAPVSDFDHAKSLEFFKISKDTFEQSIVLMKNYIKEDKNKKGTFIIDEDFKEIEADKAYWVKLDEGIDPKNLETVESKIEQII